jgi:flavin reductase (DIM6/NTAB) family NADH-FMN oxidoreductase RutF
MVKPPSSAPGVDVARFRTLLGRFATGVTVLTTRGPDGRPQGMTASAIASVSLDPPLVLVCVARACDLHPLLEAKAPFALSVLAADQEGVSRRFAADESDRFAGIAYHQVGEGLPVLDGVVAHIECEWHAAFAAGDHTIFVGRVTGGDVSDRPPLLHYRGGYTALHNP